MCTLGGWIRQNRDTEIDYSITDRIFAHLDDRGRDAFGMYEWMGSTYPKTVAKDIMVLQNACQVKDARGVMLVGRAIPASERNSSSLLDTQPFMSSGIISSHNGIIANDEELRDHYGITTGSQVDSSIIPDLISRSVATAQTRIQGSYAIAAIDTVKNELHLATNFMPLLVQEKDGVIYWASTKNQLPEGKQIDYYTWRQYTLDNGKYVKWELLNPLEGKRVVCITSGGLDSVTTCFLYKKLGYDVTMLHFRYGQKAEEVEEWATREISLRYSIPRISLDVKDLFKNMVDSVLLTKPNIPPTDRHLDMESTLSYVGARNLIFTSIGMGIAENLGAERVALGLNLDDSTYPDNNITYIQEMSKVGSLALNWNNRVKVTAPFVNLTKKEILEVALEVGSPLELQVSCYYPIFNGVRVEYCGECGCDKLREMSFKALNLKDPVPYRKEVDWGQVQEYQQKGEIPYLNYMGV